MAVARADSPSHSEPTTPHSQSFHDLDHLDHHNSSFIQSKGKARRASILASEQLQAKLAAGRNQESRDG
jgi:hypothetical protein